MSLNMKYIVLLCALVHFGLGKQLTFPDYLKQYRCRKSSPDIAKCIMENFEKARPFFLKGIREVGLPPLDPFELPVMTVNNTVNDLVRINAVCTNIKVTGGRNTIIEDVKADLDKESGEIRLTVPWFYVEMDYDVSGQLLIVPLQSKGHFIGNFTDTQMYVKASFKRYKKDGVEYYRMNKVNIKSTVGDGRLKLISKDKEMQYAADLITDFYNENPRRVMDAINPIYIDTFNEVFRVISDQILANLPASEWLPE